MALVERPPLHRRPADSAARWVLCQAGLARFILVLFVLLPSHVGEEFRLCLLFRFGADGGGGWGTESADLAGSVCENTESGQKQVILAWQAAQAATPEVASVLGQAPRSRHVDSDTTAALAVRRGQAEEARAFPR